MDITKETLYLLDALLERLRSTLLCTITLSKEAIPAPEFDISEIDEAIDRQLGPAIHAMALTLAMAQSAASAPSVSSSRDFAQGLMMQSLCYFEDDDGAVKIVDYMDLEVAWRPMPPGPATKIFYEEPE